MNETRPAARALMACLGEESRFHLVQALIGGARCVTDLAAAVGLSQSCTTRHLQALERRGVVRGRREGKRVLYRIREDHPDLMPLLGWAMLAGAGARGRGRPSPRPARPAAAPASGRATGPGPGRASVASGPSAVTTHDSPAPTGSPGARGNPIQDRDGDPPPAQDGEPPPARRRQAVELEDFLL